MKIIILYLCTFFIFSCAKKEEEEELVKILNEIEVDDNFRYKFSQLKNNRVNDSIYVLKNESFSEILKNYSGKIVFKDSLFFLEKKDEKIIYLYDFTINKNLSYLTFTVGKSGSVEVFLKKIKATWSINHIEINKQIQLKASKAKYLSEYIIRSNLKKNDYNISKVKIGMDSTEVIKIMDSKYLLVKDSITAKIHFYNSAYSDFKMHRIYFDSLGVVVDKKVISSELGGTNR